ncbi:fimbrial protein [Atlantibacter sp.]|uniref:fimbrial protein n=1 Tax=Atlantibacter sp. TaxID=1903473 RepID=UPI0028A6F424|nr:fimbrial protein [Atlantibacter sp.]
MKRLLTRNSLGAAVALLAITSVCNSARAADCNISDARSRVNLNVPAVVQLPINTGSAASGTVLYRKEAPLSVLTGMHKNIDMSCLDAARKRLTGRIPSAQSGKNIFNTNIDGLGLRITVMYHTSDGAQKSWTLPFDATVLDLNNKTISTDDISLRLEVIKTGTVNTSNSMEFRVPYLVALADNLMVVSLTMKVMAAKSFCAIQVANPQVTLPPIEASELAKNSDPTAYPVDISLNCINTQKASINIEGLVDPAKPSIFKNVADDAAASGVGIQMLYNNSVMLPGQAMAISLPTQQNNFALPLTIRYAKTNDKITSGQVKSQITLRINYL